MDSLRDGARRGIRVGLALVPAVILATGLGGCGESPARVEGTALEDGEALELAMAVSEQVGTVTDSEMERQFGEADLDAASGTVGSGVRSREVQFRRSRTCRLGGELRVAGTLVRTVDIAEKVATLDVRARKVHRRCGVRIRGHRIILQGDPALALRAHREWKNRKPHGLQTHGVRGTVAWRSDDGRRGSCEIRLDIVADPEAGTRTVTGEICGREVDRTRTASGDRG